MQLKNITEDATYDITKHKVYPPNLKVLEQKTTMKKQIAKLVKVQGNLLDGSFWTSASLYNNCFVQDLIKCYTKWDKMLICTILV